MELPESEPFDLGVAEASAMLSVHPDSLKKWTDEGRVICWRTPGGHRRYRRSDIVALLEDATSTLDETPAAS